MHILNTINPEGPSCKFHQQEVVLVWNSLPGRNILIMNLCSSRSLTVASHFKSYGVTVTTWQWENTYILLTRFHVRTSNELLMIRSQEEARWHSTISAISVKAQGPGFKNCWIYFNRILTCLGNLSYNFSACHAISNDPFK